MVGRDDNRLSIENREVYRDSYDSHSFFSVDDFRSELSTDLLKGVLIGIVAWGVSVLTLTGVPVLVRLLVTLDREDVGDHVKDR